MFAAAYVRMHFVVVILYSNVERLLFDVCAIVVGVGDVSAFVMYLFPVVF